MVPALPPIRSWPLKKTALAGLYCSSPEDDFASIDDPYHPKFVRIHEPEELLLYVNYSCLMGQNSRTVKRMGAVILNLCHLISKLQYIKPLCVCKNAYVSKNAAL